MVTGNAERIPRSGVKVPGWRYVVDVASVLRVDAVEMPNGGIRSHGCIHVPAPHAEQLFDWAGSTDIWVIIIGT